MLGLHKSFCPIVLFQVKVSHLLTTIKSFDGPECRLQRKQIVGDPTSLACNNILNPQFHIGTIGYYLASSLIFILHLYQQMSNIVSSQTLAPRYTHLFFYFCKQLVTVYYLLTVKVLKVQTGLTSNIFATAARIHPGFSAFASE